ncbi:MAG: spore germination protein [Dethiobacteria bacterium]|nr:spore germination protein [Bacillota bacterium]HOB29148.1 spore germination protein [Bacillota bacterium]HPZ41760.1 spore germination protein [Bacillota bacterium]HQD52596.1 spore germination protein [Bacillota bacterium]
MFNWLKNKLGLNRRTLPRDADRDISFFQEKAAEEKLSGNLEANLNKIQEAGGFSYDISIRRFMAGSLPGALVYLEGLTDRRSTEEIIRTLVLESEKTKTVLKRGRGLESAREKLLTADELSPVENIADLFAGIARGGAALFLDGSPGALICDTREPKTRPVSEPENETTLRGPRDGFIENLRTNTSLLRLRLPIPQLWIETMTIGRLSRTEVALVYLKGLARETLVREVHFRLQQIEIDAILGTGYLEDFIEDNPFTLFPLTYRTERPDKVTAALLEGRVAILAGETPFALIVPTELPMLMQAPDDYYEPLPTAIFIRLLRYTALVTSLLLPGFYVAVVTFHPELLPTSLFLRIISTREGVPFPVVAEMLILELILEILREAGLRLPPAIGPAISIVGALILGDAAIRAGLVSPGVVIIVALTAIAGFSTPNYALSASFRLLRFAFTILGAAFGLFGLQFALLLTIIHLCSLRSFGIPYLSPLAPLILPDLKDSFITVWWWGMRSRPKLLGGREPLRQPPGQKPQPGPGPEKPRKKRR